MTDTTEIAETAMLMEKIRARWIVIDKELVERLRTINYTQPETIQVNSTTTMTAMWNKGSQSCISFSITDEKETSTVKTVNINTLIEATESLQKLISEINSKIQALKDKAKASISVLDEIGTELSIDDEDKTNTRVSYARIAPEGPINDDTPIWRLDVDVRTYNALTHNGILTVGDLCRLTESQFRNIRNLGRKSWEQAKQKLASHYLSFAGEPIVKADSSISVFALDDKTHLALVASGCNTIGDLLKRTIQQIYEITGEDDFILRTIQSRLRLYGFRLRAEHETEEEYQACK